MSLKIFHIIFIVSSIIIASGFGYWGISHFQQQRMMTDLWMGIGSLILAVGLIVYEVTFLKKNKDVR